jgi:hypothetical protein
MLWSLDRSGIGEGIDRQEHRPGASATAEQEEGFSLLILAYFIAHPLIT